MKKVFISLPITSRSEKTLEERIYRAKNDAREKADIFKKEGYEVVTPFDVTKDGMTLMKSKKSLKSSYINMIALRAKLLEELS